MASITLTYSAADAQRIAVALGRKQGLTDSENRLRPATGGEVKSHIASYFVGVVQQQERQAKREEVEASLLPDVVIT